MIMKKTCRYICGTFGTDATQELSHGLSMFRFRNNRGNIVPHDCFIFP